MLPDLLKRDLRLHARVLVAASLLPLFFLAVLLWSPGARQNAEGSALILWLFGLLLLALLPLSLQVREGMLHTLDDLLALPIHRRDLVHLRYAEGLLGCALFSLLFAAEWALLHRGTTGGLGEAMRSPALLWVLLLFLAFPLPFYLRWRGPGVAAAYGLLGFTLYALMVYGLKQGHASPGFRLLGALQCLHGSGALGAALVDYGLPLLLLSGCYGFARWACERMEA